jgi:DNA-binding transcriptional regulator YiaG
MENNGHFYKEIMQRINAHYGQKTEKTDIELKNEISLKLKAYRLEHRLTQDELAKKLGYSRMQIIRWEEKKSKPNNAALKLMRHEGVL